MKFIITAILICAALLGQSVPGGSQIPAPKGVPAGTVVSGSNITFPGTVSVGNTVLGAATLPSTCTPGSWTALTAAVSAQATVGLYQCPALDTWCKVPFGTEQPACYNSNLSAYYTARNSAADLGTHYVPIVWVGDSISQGTGASDDAHSAVSLLRANLQSRYGNGGYGMIGSWRTDLLTYAGTWNCTSWGMGTCRAATGTGNTITATVTGDAVDILFMKYGYTADFTVTIDGGSPVTVSATGAGGTPASAITTVSMGSNTSHTVVITAPSGTNQILFSGLSPHIGTNGIRLHNIGHAGTQVGSWVGNAGSLDFFPLLSPKLTVVALTINDYTAQTALSTYTTQLTAIATAGKATGSCVIVGTNKSNDISKTITEVQYHSAAKAVAASIGCAFYDVSDYFGTWAMAQGQQRMADGLHPNNAGHAFMAGVVASMF